MKTKRLADRIQAISAARPWTSLSSPNLRRRVAAWFYIAAALAVPARAFAQVRPCLSISCPAAIVVECAGHQGTVVTFAPVVHDACGGVSKVECTPPSGSTFPPGSTRVVCTATDSLNHKAACEFVVTVQDTTPPVVLNGPVTADCTGPAGAVVNFTADVRDNCDPNPQAVFTPPSGSTFPIGTNLVTCVATDAAGNGSTNTFPVVVSGACSECVDITCPGVVQTATAGPNGMALVQFAVTATNHCGGPVEVQCVPPSGSWFPAGITLVKCSALVNGEVARQCNVEVWVKDLTPPSISVRGGFTFLCTGFDIHSSAGAAVDLAAHFAATDNVDPNPVLAFDPPSGSFFAVGDHTVTCTATDAAGNQAKLSVQVHVLEGLACEVSDPVTKIDDTDNWDFELGLKTWIKTGGAFDHQPTVGDNVHAGRLGDVVQQMAGAVGGDYWRDLSYPIGHHGGHWIGTAENHPDDSTAPGTLQGNAAIGTLVSKAFVLQQPMVTFLIGGDEDDQLLRVEFLAPGQPGDPGVFKIGSAPYKVVQHATGRGSERLRRQEFNVGDYVGQICRIRIVDNSPTGHINVDDFRFQPSPMIFTTVTEAGVTLPSVVLHDGNFYDWNAPVWGLADMHTHPMSHLGVGERVMHGRPDGDISQALANCNDDHGGWGTDNPDGNYLRQLVMLAFDPKAGDDHQAGWDANEWKRFQKWPIFRSYSHQQMWHEWIRRAYDGGLRTIVALTVHDKLLAQAMLGSVAPFDDVTVMDQQIDEMKAFVGRHSDFMEIAYDPFQLREIVRNNKLAIILGSETDDIGGFDGSDQVSEDASGASKQLIHDRLQALYDKGLRYIFPVHLTDNKLGGTAVYDPLFAVATKFYMHKPLLVEAADEGVVFNLPELNLLDKLPSADDILGALAKTLTDPFAPVRLLVEANTKATGSGKDVSQSSVGVAAVGAMAMLPMIAASPATLSVAPLIISFIGDFTKLGLPAEILPTGANYPTNRPVGPSGGEQNSKGLTDLGAYALGEMMKLGMMIDLDHMSQKAVESVLDLGEAAPHGYPLNSGHNSFRALRYDASENQRTADQLDRIRRLGGVMGLGWGNADFRSAGQVLAGPQTNSASVVANDNAGSSKTFAQSAVYALEGMGGSHVALGSDINGFVVGPGPRFGPQSAFGLRNEASAERAIDILFQHNGVAYSPTEGRPGMTAVFDGPSVDHDTDDHDPRGWLGYAYNKQQRDFFMALRIFRWGWQKTPTITNDEIQTIIDNLNHSGYDWDRVKEFARGLLLGPNDLAPGSDLGDPDVEVKQRLAKAVYRNRTFGEPPPDDILGDKDRIRRYLYFISVWEDYNRIYGKNTPMTRCSTDGVEWDYNFDGLAHYGLLPDFFQDLSNVGFASGDLSPLFRSAEDVAQMWTQTLRSAYAINHPNISGLQPMPNGPVQIQWFGLDGSQLEESDDLDGAGWRPFSGEIQGRNGRRTATLNIDPRAARRFYRVRVP